MHGREGIALDACVPRMDRKATKTWIRAQESNSRFVVQNHAYCRLHQPGVKVHSEERR